MRLKSHYRCSRCALLTPDVFPRDGQLLCTACLGRAVLQQVHNLLEGAPPAEEASESATILQLRPRSSPVPAQ